MTNFFENKFPNIIERVEKYLVFFVVFNLVVVFSFQVLLTQNKIRPIISKTDNIEIQEQYSNLMKTTGGMAEQEKIFSGSITLEIANNSSLPKMNVLVNGAIIGDFSNKQVTIRVKGGDLLEVDGTSYPHIIEVKVVSVSDLVVKPEIDSRIFTHQSIESLGRIHIQGS